MKILGIYCGHDANCCIVNNDTVAADIQEERLCRIKHSSNFPVNALTYCLKVAQVAAIDQLDWIAVPSREVNPYLGSIMDISLDARKRIAQRSFPNTWSRPQILGPGGMPRIDDIKPPVYIKKYTLLDHEKLCLVNHHLAHAAAAHYTRTVADKCLVFTMDGIGDGVCIAVWEAAGSTIKLLQRFGREASIGWAYSLVTEGLGWQHGDGEGKTMGLAPYGDSTLCRGCLDRYFPAFRGTELIRNSGIGSVYRWFASGATHWHFNEAEEIQSLCTHFGRENVAAEAQRKLEEVICGYVYAWMDRMAIDRCAFGGGLFLNVKLNQRIREGRDKRIMEQHIFPNPGDGGLALGAALCINYRYMEFVGQELKHIYWGPSYDDEYIEKMLKLRGVTYRTEGDIAVYAAERLHENRIVAWFQGPMESGPRALGNRSILMAPNVAENKDAINERVKFRESFRPFCPSISFEYADNYLVDINGADFMITSFQVKDAYKSALAAVTHVDGSVRPQIVRRNVNPLYWSLLNEYGKRSGVYALLNTSLNVRGDPIACTPSDALRLFYDSGVDVLVIGKFVVEKA